VALLVPVEIGGWTWKASRVMAMAKMPSDRDNVLPMENGVPPRSSSSLMVRRYLCGLWPFSAVR
jgi:hypothetical protein